MYLKNFKKEELTPKILYLDQLFWIGLAKVHYGRDNDAVLSRILNKLIETISNGKLIIPLNLTNIMEAQKIKNMERREKLAKFMVFLSKGYSFIPYPYIEYNEIENIVLEKLKLPLHNIRELAIGKGILYMISDGTPNFLPKFYNSSNSLVNETKEILAKLLLKNQSIKDDYIINFIMKPRESTNFSNLIKKLEQLRINGYKTKDKKLKKIRGIAQYIINSIAPLLYNAYINNNLDPMSIRLNEEQKIYGLLKNLPFFNTQYLLFEGLDKSRDHKITPNDIFDIRSFSFALPYSDFVAGEKYIISLAKRNKVDKFYFTKLFNKSDFLDIEVELDKLKNL